MNFLAAAASKPTPLVDWAGLSKVLVTSAIFVLVLVCVVSAGIALATRSETSTGSRKVLSGIGAIVCVGVTLAAVGVGLTVMLSK